MTTDTSEKGLETLIVRAMTGTEWIAGNPEDYDREYCVDLAQLSAFLRATQPEVAEALDLDQDGAAQHLGGHVREAVGVAKAAAGAAVFEKQSR